MTSLDLQSVLNLHGKWLANDPDGVRANRAGANLRGTDLSYANLRRANMRGTNLAGANLTGANLRRSYLHDANLRGANLDAADLTGADPSYANLRRANMTRANLAAADLTGANLIYANLAGANLSAANLTGANISHANLTGADLRNADLSYANLTGANLSDTDLHDANLSDANLHDADLTGTCCDPRNVPPDATAILTAAGLTIKNGMVYGWRTKISKLVGCTAYEPGRYSAGVFSTCTETECHPGIYFSTKEWIVRMFGKEQEIVPVASWVCCVVAAGDKFRTKELWVLEQ